MPDSACCSSHTHGEQDLSVYFDATMRAVLEEIGLALGRDCGHTVTGDLPLAAILLKSAQLQAKPTWR